MKALIGETNRVLGMAVDQGLKDNRPPAEMITKLRNDVFVFSACKTHINLKEVGSHLVDENGNINSWQKFSQQVTAIYKQYNENHLQAEYIFATSSAEMAAKWNRFAQDGDRYNLQYRTAKDDRVRDAHAKMDGITLPVSDPFWDSYFPPNGWRCRCTTVQVLKDKYPVDNSTEAIKKADAATVQIDSKGRDRGDMFRFNPGKQQVIFPPNHPYYKVKQAISSIVNSLIKDNSLSGFEMVKSFDNGGEVAVHDLVNRKAGDYQDILSICTHFAKKGSKTKILPQVHFKNPLYKSLYGDLIETPFENKCPDFKVENHFYEYESHTRPFNKNKIRKMISRGLEQSSRIVIDNSKGAPDHYIMRTIDNRMKVNQKIDELWLYEDGKIRLLYKKQ